MAMFGSISLLMALVFSFYAFTAGILALWRGSAADQLAETARRAGIASFWAVVGAATALVISVLNNDFSLAYIRDHSNITLPLLYKFAALWSGQEGSLLFWALLLSTYAFVVRIKYRQDVKLFAYASVILGGAQFFFLLLIIRAAHPFAIVPGNPPADGNGLNVLLQYPEMVIHPPMLYLGYVGLAVPFAFALGALIMRYPGEKWIHITRRWTMWAWLFLTCGIFLGAHWAYSVLGWGGYWAWDPVENASLLPWLTATAFLHSVMMQEKRGMMKVWNVWLIFLTFMLSIFGTFLTRSGIINSVHAFAQSSIGDWFIWFMLIVAAVFIFFFIKNRDHLKSENRLESLVSRESSFLFNNLVLLASCFAVLWGTLFPVLSDWVQGHKVTVGPPFFNNVNIPIGLFLLFLTAVGPVLAWRSTSWASIQRNLIWPAAAMVVSVIAMIGGGMRPWNDISQVYSLVAVALAVFVFIAISGEFWRGARVVAMQTGKNVFAALVHLIRRNTRRYGGYIVHYGVVVVCIGFAGAAFNQSVEKELAFRDTLEIGNYKLVCQKYTQDEKPNYVSDMAILDVYENGKMIGTMYPEQRFYKPNDQPAHMVAIHSTMKEDLYLVYAGRNQENDHPIIKAHLNPLVMWIWTGVIIMVFGTLIALVPPTKPGQGKVAVIHHVETAAKTLRADTPEEVAAREALA